MHWKASEIRSRSVLMWWCALAVVRWAATGASALIMLPMSPMSAMHEDVQQRACEEEEKGQIGDGRGDMRAVLRHQEVSPDREEPDQRNIRRRREKAAALALVIAMIHTALLCC